MEENWSEMQEKALQWIQEAGELLRASLEESLIIETKSNPNDLVTEMDFKIERLLTKKIVEEYPGHRILGEEEAGADITDTDDIIWIIDPIDGTTNFVHQQFNFAVSLAVFENGTGKVGIVYDVMADEWFTALEGRGAYRNDIRLPELAPVEIKEAIVGINARWIKNEKIPYARQMRNIVDESRSTRAYGSAALELCYVACGRLDSYVNLWLAPWDFAGAEVLLREVGADISTIDNQRPSMLEKGPYLAGRPGLQEKVRGMLNS